MFYTNGWIFGENLAVQSLGHDAIKPSRVAAAAVGTADPAAAAMHSEISKCASETSVVLSGKVTAIGETEPPAMEMARSRSTDSQRPIERQPVSEHDPFWTEAVVEVQAVHKGRINKKRVTVRFPSSTDVRWSDAPKFQVGQQGLFMLEPDQVSHQEKVGATAAAAGSTEAFTCLHPLGFRTEDREAEIATALQAIGAKKP